MRNRKDMNRFSFLNRGYAFKGLLAVLLCPTWSANPENRSFWQRGSYWLPKPLTSRAMTDKNNILKNMKCTSLINDVNFTVVTQGFSVCNKWCGHSPLHEGSELTYYGLYVHVMGAISSYMYCWHLENLVSGLGVLNLILNTFLFDVHGKAMNS